MSVAAMLTRRKGSCWDEEDERKEDGERWRVKGHKGWKREEGEGE